MTLTETSLPPVTAMTTDEVESVHKKQVCEQQQEEEDPAAQEPGPADTAQDSPSGTSPPPGGSEEEQQLKPRQRTSTGRGLSRLFSSFLKRRSQCSDGEGVETERAREKDSQEEPKAPIADPEPELHIEGDVALDQHSVSSAENQVRKRNRVMVLKLEPDLRFNSDRNSVMSRL